MTKKKTTTTNIYIRKQLNKDDGLDFLIIFFIAEAKNLVVNWFGWLCGRGIVAAALYMACSMVVIEADSVILILVFPAKLCL